MTSKIIALISALITGVVGIFLLISATETATSPWNEEEVRMEKNVGSLLVL
jgi:hypothetical protein